MHRSLWFACVVASAAAFIAQQQRPRYALHAVDVSLEKPLGLVLEENVRDAPEGLYVAEIGADGSASACADIKVEDRLDAVNGVDTTSMGFDDVMDLIVDAPSPVRLKFSGPTCKLTVSGPKGETTFEVKKGANLRKELLARKQDVYDFKGKMMNCNGGGQCGLCAVRVADGAFGPRYEWEERHVAKLGADARLACQTTVKGGDAATVTLQAK
jgi:ferredoxin